MFWTPWTSSLRSPGGLFATYGNFAREMGADQWFSSEIRADVLVGPRGSRIILNSFCRSTGFRNKNCSKVTVVHSLFQAEIHSASVTAACDHTHNFFKKAKVVLGPVLCPFFAALCLNPSPEGR